MSVTLHTNFGDLKIEVFCESVPKTAEVSLQERPSHKHSLTDDETELLGALRIGIL